VSHTASAALEAAPAAPLAQRIFGALADGELHSGEQLAAAEDVSRSAVWKTVGSLQELGLAIESVPHRGYRLAGPLVPLEATRIRALIAPDSRERLRSAEVAWSLASTNSALLSRGEQHARAVPPPGRFDFMAAEHQTAGRGRRARAWLAPPGGALCMSLGWSFAALPSGVSALSLAMGVCVRRALSKLTPRAISLKWPNDLQVEDHKLGGILIELRAEAAGPAYAVIGIGINCSLGTALTHRVRDSGTEPIDLASLGLVPCDRNWLAAVLVDELVQGVLAFERDGFVAFSSEWSAADALAGRMVSVRTSGSDLVGRACGVAADGTLRVDCGGIMRQFHTGEVSVRAQS
jgi:BirA family transcriptional regulator, biotin operon repressor / biotin---[acetyl-CoA-carboxylase] ligase